MTDTLSRKPSRRDAAAAPAPAPPAAARRPRWLPTVATVLGVALFVTAGNWQRGRMERKEALRESIAVAAAAVPIPLPGGDADWEALQWRNVTAQGRYDATRQILIDNRVHDGQAGYDVVTPLLLADGHAILVKRGWVAAGRDRRVVPDAPPPPGPVQVTGRLVIPSQGYLELRHDPPSGRVWQNLDPARVAATTGLPVPRAVIEASAQGAPPDGLVRKWPEPDTGIEKHRIYMVQWYSFAALAVVLWAWFHLRPSRRQAS